MRNITFPDQAKFTWIDEMSLQCGDITLQLMPGLACKPSSNESISLFKDPDFVANYVDCLRDHSIRNMVEVGVKHGGSAIFFWHLLELKNLCCIELSPRAPQLSSYIARSNLDKALHTHFGVDQADKEKLREFVAGDFSGEPIDLVVDDASHIYTPSLATFEALFPLIRPGGLYILEDWRASLLAVQRVKGAASEPRLDSLVHEILEFSTINPNIIPSIKCNKNFVVIERGEGELPVQGFCLAEPAEYFVPAKNRLG
ncbi:MAG: class I SAM-dependent methyltransferase [Halioglobus sp.]